jgi:hypothetical protein
VVLTDVSEERIASIFRVEEKYVYMWCITPHIHGAKSQKTAFFIVIAVKASNVTRFVAHFALPRRHV